MRVSAMCVVLALPHRAPESRPRIGVRGDVPAPKPLGNGVRTSAQVPEGKCDRADGDRDDGHSQQDQGMREAEAVNQRFICFVVVEKRRESAGS